MKYPQQHTTQILHEATQKDIDYPHKRLDLLMPLPTLSVHTCLLANDAIFTEHWDAHKQALYTVLALHMDWSAL